MIGVRFFILFGAISVFLLMGREGWTAPLSSSQVRRLDGGHWRPFSRNVLVIYFGTRKETDDKNNFRAYWDFPLNYLGLKARYHNLRLGLPDPRSLGRYRAVFLQIDNNPIPHARSLWIFLDSLLDQHIKVVFLSSFPESRRLSVDDGTSQIRNRVLARIGLLRVGVWDVNSFDLSYGHRDRSMEGFEYSLPSAPPEFRPLVNHSSGNHVFLGVKSKIFRNRGLESVYALSGPWGGLVFDPFMIRWPSLDSSHTLWYVNPFRFLERVLDIRDTPRMDLTTLNGRRIFYSQVDGDAFETLSRYKRRRMSAEVLYREVFSRIDLPFTVSVITSQIDPDFQGSANRVYWARKILSLPNVEAGSHTFSHPFYWNPSKKRKDEGPVHIDIPHYIFDLKAELNGSIDWINRTLLPPGKKVRVMQWSGNTRPGADALAQLSTTSVLNINGSDSRFDSNAPSYTFVFPYFRRVGPYTQYYNSDVNDYILTNHWTGPYFGYLNVLETFRRTDRPRRVDPINVYFHFYAGERESSLNALLQVLGWVRRQPIAPLYSSEFVRVEQGFIEARIEEEKNWKGVFWKIDDYGRDLTVRFDHAGSLYPDFSQSRGIIGYRHRGNYLYLYLSPDDPQAIVHLSVKKPVLPYLSRSTGRIHVRDLSSPLGFEFEYDGWEPQDQVVWADLSPEHRYTVTSRTVGGSGKAAPRTFVADPDGHLAISGLRKGEIYRLSP